MAGSEEGYIYDPIGTDRDALQQQAFDYIQARWPDWTPSDSNLEAWLIAALANMVAEARDVAADVPRAVFRYLGTSVLGIPPVDPTGAIVASTWTLTANPTGITIPVGHLVGIADPEGETIVFEVIQTVDVPAPTLTTDPGQVLLRAVEEGEFANGLGGIDVEAVDIESRTWVDTILMTSATSAGNDGETDDEYLDRLSNRLTLLTPRPILPRDFALLAVDIAAQNGATVRALVLDGYNPVDETDDNERMVTVALVDRDSGGDVSGGILAIVDSELQAAREVNFIIHVVNPNRTTADTTVAFKVLPGFDLSETEDAVESALNDYYQSANWGSPANLEGFSWVNQDKIRRMEVATAVNNIVGVDYITSLTIGLNGGAQTTAEEFTLTGAAPLTTPGAIVATASA